MKTSFRKTDTCLGNLTIKITNSDFEPNLNNKIKETSKKISMKGFRQGRVPLGLINKLHGQSFKLETINELINKELNDFLKEKKENYLGVPRPLHDEQEKMDWTNDAEFEFHYEIGFAEPFELSINPEFKLNKYQIKITDDIVNEAVDNLTQQFGESIETKEVSENDTLKVILVNTLATLDGKSIYINSEELSDETAEKLKGLKLGSTSKISIKEFKSEDDLPSILGIPEDDLKMIENIEFTIEEIKHVNPAKLNKEFYQKVFKEENIIEKKDFLKKMKEKVKENFSVPEKKYFNYTLIKQLIDKTPINLPDKYLKKFLLEKNKELTKDSIEKEYEFYSIDLKWSLIKGKVMDDNKIQVEHKDVMDRTKQIITYQFQSLEMRMDDQLLDSYANRYLQEEQGKNYMQMMTQAEDEKVIEHIENNITITEKEISLDEFRKL